MTEIVKKNWFVLVVAVAFTFIAIYFAYDQNKDKLPGKRVQGADVVFSIGDLNVTADTLYDEYYRTGGEDAAYMLMQRALLDASVTVTSEMKEEAQSMADQFESYFQSVYGDNAEAYIQLNLNAVGLTSLYDYCLYNVKLEALISDYVNQNIDTLYPAFAENYKPRMVSHVLVKIEDPDHPTDEESKRFAEVKQAWENRGDMDFKTFAETYSDDTNSAVNGGSIGYVDTTSSLVTPFLETALALNEGEVSEWIQSEYGYHLITVTSTQQADITQETAFLESILTYYPNLEKELTWAKLQEKNVSFADTELEAAIKEALHVEDTNQEKEVDEQ